MPSNTVRSGEHIHLDAEFSKYRRQQHDAGLPWMPNTPRESGKTGRAPRGSNVTQRAGLQDTLLSLATISTALSPGGLDASLDYALDLLRDAVGADSAELFLADPISHDLLLTAFRGPYWRAFCEATRFVPGSGFPGKVLQSGVPVTTNTLPSDPRFLRSAVTRKGFHAYVCVPLFAGKQIIGTVSLGSRRADFPTDEAVDLLTWTSALLTNVVQAGLLQASRIALPEPPGHQDGTSHLDPLLDALLLQILNLSKADAASITVVGHRGSSPIQRTTEGFAIESLMSCPLRGESAHDCPAMDDELGVALWGPRRDWPQACRELSRPGRASYCLPLRHGRHPVGLIHLVYQVSAPCPPTQPLGLLHEFANQAAELLAFVGGYSEGQSISSHQEPSNLGDRRERSPLLPQKQDSFESLDQDARLHIRCFGPCEIMWDRSSISLRMFVRRKALTLFKILVLHAGQPVAKDALIEWLWPDSDPDAGANRLHGIVHALRQVIEPPTARGAWQIIHSEEESYRFQPLLPYWTDLGAFRANIDAGERADELGDAVEALACFEKAIDLYRGDLFADDLYADWCMLEREVLRETYLNTLHRLAELLVDSNSIDRAIMVCRQLVRHDPLRESIHQLLIESLWRAGRRDEAVRHYNRFLDLLQIELQTEPLPETISLMQRLRRDLTV